MNGYGLHAKGMYIFSKLQLHHRAKYHRKYPLPRGYPGPLISCYAV